MKQFWWSINQIVSVRKNLWLRLLFCSFLVIGVAALVVQRIQRERDLRLQLNDQAILASPGVNPEIVRIPLLEAKAALDEKEAVFLDVRSSASYKNGHIPGAVNIPLGDILKRYQELDPARRIILYCT